MLLTDVLLKNLKSSESPKKYKDLGGLYLYSAPTA
ncbi:MAG: Arm DNA-binding domain-containing protein [Deltaproteobacteria bacterium]|nr:Arm DNA-binding domain-containing protein [Deltaproteobacteria bacterium]